MRFYELGQNNCDIFTDCTGELFLKDSATTSWNQNGGAFRSPVFPVVFVLFGHFHAGSDGDSGIAVIVDVEANIAIFRHCQAQAEPGHIAGAAIRQ